MHVFPATEICNPSPYKFLFRFLRNPSHRRQDLCRNFSGGVRRSITFSCRLVMPFGQVIWPGLEGEHGWNKVYGPRNDTYYLPRGIERGKNGAKCRLDFFDSFKQVIGFSRVCLRAPATFK